MKLSVHFRDMAQGEDFDSSLLVISSSEAALFDTERRNVAAREASDDLNQIRQEELAGTRAGRITITGVVDKEKAAAQAREKARVEGDARMQALLALQAQLDADIEVLDIQIDALDELLGIFDSGEPLDPNNPEHMDILRRSGFPEDQWGKITRDDVIRAKEEREAERDAKQAARDELEEDIKVEMQSMSYSEQQDYADRKTSQSGAATAEAVAEKLDVPQREAFDTAAGNEWFGGNTAGQDQAASFAAAFGAGNMFAGVPSVGGTSFANNASPDTLMRESAPPIKSSFETASTQSEAVEPVAQVDLTNTHEKLIENNFGNRPT